MLLLQAAAREPELEGGKKPAEHQALLPEPEPEPEPEADKLEGKRDAQATQGGAADTRSKMRPDMMIVEMTTAGQQQYLRHDDNSGSRLTPLTPKMLMEIQGA
ncbi:TPA: hypothetical protein ACH3X3_001250 [Trebouxia sp. C0006]